MDLNFGNVKSWLFLPMRFSAYKKGPGEVILTPMAANKNMGDRTTRLITDRIKSVILFR